MTDYREQFDAIRGLSLPPSGGRPKGDITLVEKGGYLEFDGNSFKVVKKSRYQEVKWEDFSKLKREYWVTEFELFNLITGEKSTIEWAIDDELEVSVTSERVSLLDISFNGGHLKYSDLEHIADEEEGVVSYSGRKFHYDEDETWAALFYGDGSDEPSQVRMMEFTDRDKTNLTVELWEEEGSKPDKEAFLSLEINPKKMLVLQDVERMNSEVSR